MRQVSQEHQKQVQVEVASQTRNIQHDSVENHIQHKPDETRVKARDDQKVIYYQLFTIGLRFGKAASLAFPSYFVV